MDKPTLLIGIGTSGLKVLEQVQNFHYESTGKNKPENVEYLYLETDENAHPSVTALKNEITRVHISLSERETMINSLKSDSSLNTPWLPPARHILDSGFGAGGLPAFGRVALWGKENFEQVHQQISDAFQRVGSHTVQDSDDTKPAVFITGSLTGGTGTGVFIDMAYLVRNLLHDISEVFGLFLIPGRQSYDGQEVIYANTYASLKMLEYFNKKENTYEMRWPNGHDVSFDEPPYEYTQFISQDYNGNIPSISSLTGLYKMAGMYLFLNVFGMRQKRLVRFGDAKSNGHLDKYGTFGLSAIQYPKSQLEEHLAIQLTEEMLGRWVDPNSYYNNGTKTPIQTTRHITENRVKRHFEEFIRQAFTDLDASEVQAGRKVIDDLQLQARILRNKEHDAANELEYIQSRFSSNQTGNYYSAIKNNIRAAEDTLIERIAELVKDVANQFENLYIVREHLEAFVKAIDDTVKYWQSLKVSGKPERWEVMLNNQGKWMLKNRYRLLLQGDAVMADRMRSTLELMKMHLFAHRMVDVRKSILEGEITLKSNGNIDLPRIKQVDKSIAIINDTLGRNDDATLPRNFKTLRARKEEIQSDINDTTIPILRVFPSGNLEEELERSMARYKREINNQIAGKESIGEADLWEYLHKRTDGMHMMLYRDGISQFERELRKYGAVPDMDVSEYVKKEPTESIKVARRATYPLVKINSDKQTLFGNSMYVPKLVVGQTKEVVENALSHFKEEKYSEFKSGDDGIWSRDELKNMLVFYEERGYMQDKTNFEPLRHLRFIDEIIRLYEEYPRLKNISPEEWHMLRVPYYPFQSKAKKS